jgi:acetyltransferase-like isoleucine patch superfamily enzyme
VIAAVRALRWRWWALATRARLRRLGGRLRLEADGTPRLLGPLHVDTPARAGTLTLRIGRGVTIGRDCVIELLPGTDGTVALGDGVVVQDRVRLQAFGGSIAIGPRTQVRDGVELKARGALTVGERAVLGRHATIHCAQEVTLESAVGLGEKCSITDSDHAVDGSDTCYLDQPVVTAAVRLEHNVLCGTNATILRGAHIGRNSVVAAGAVVTGGEHPSGWLMVGVPATPLKPLATARPDDPPLPL